MIPLLILLALDFFLGLSLFWTAYSESRLFFWIGALVIQLTFASILWLFFIFFKSDADTKIRFEKPIQQFAFGSMGLLSFFFTFTAVRDFLALVLMVFGSPLPIYGLVPSMVIVGLSVVSLAIGLLNAKFRIVSPRVEVPIANLPKTLDGMRIVQLSDIHLGTGPNTQQVAAMVNRALSLKPDLIALTGDIIDGMVDEMKPELAELARLKAPHGVYFVLGNHECYWKHPDAIRVMKEMGFIVLQNEGFEQTIRGEKIYVSGLNDPAIVHFKGEKPSIPTPPQNSKFNLLLVHQPYLWKKVSDFPYHLQLSGHTHGGQFFPWNFVVRLVHPIDRGLRKVKDLWVYVSVGSGYWGPPVRLGTDGEVTELILKPE